MTAVAITAQGTVTGTSTALVAAAAALVAAIPAQRAPHADRVAELVAIVRTPLDALI